MLRITNKSTAIFRLTPSKKDQSSCQKSSSLEAAWSLFHAWNIYLVDWRMRLQLVSPIPSHLPLALRLLLHNPRYKKKRKEKKYIPISCSVACRTLSAAHALTSSYPRCTSLALDVSSTADLDAAIAAHDLVISLIPYAYHAAVIKSAIKSGKNVVTTSYVSSAMRDLEAEVRDAGIVVMNEVGVDPGVDHLYAIKTIGDVHAKGGKVCNLRPSNFAVTLQLASRCSPLSL